MATASEILSAIAPQFDDATGRQAILDLSESRTSETRFGTQRSEAVAYRAAHVLALSSQTGAWAGGGTGAIASKKEGDLAVSFHAPAGTKSEDAYFAQTSYGQMLLDLIRSRGPAMMVTGQPWMPFTVAGYRP